MTLLQPEAALDVHAHLIDPVLGFLERALLRASEREEALDALLASFAGFPSDWVASGVWPRDATEPSGDDKRDLTHLSIRVDPEGGAERAFVGVVVPEPLLVATLTGPIATKEKRVVRWPILGIQARGVFSRSDVDAALDAVRGILREERPGELPEFSAPPVDEAVHAARIARDAAQVAAWALARDPQPDNRRGLRELVAERLRWAHLYLGNGIRMGVDIGETGVDGDGPSPWQVQDVAFGVRHGEPEVHELFRTASEESQTNAWSTDPDEDLAFWGAARISANQLEGVYDVKLKITAEAERELWELARKILIERSSTDVAPPSRIDHPAAEPDEKGYVDVSDPVLGLARLAAHAVHGTEEERYRAFTALQTIQSTTMLTWLARSITRRKKDDAYGKDDPPLRIGSFYAPGGDDAITFSFAVEIDAFAIADGDVDPIRPAIAVKLRLCRDDFLVAGQRLKALLEGVSSET